MKKLSSIILLVCTSISFALEGGPTQPDYIQFEPSDMKDMVSPISGNFSYSIPLGEVPSAYGNYPLSLAYHAGISPQTEASWVGLGWTLSPGSIVRDLRGVPDDQFHGGTLGYIYQYSALFSWSVDMSYSNGVFSAGVNASSTGGFGVSATVGVQISGCANVGFTVSTNQGVGVSGSVGFDNGSSGLNASVMFSPRSKDWTFAAGASAGGEVQASIGVQYTTGQDVSAHVGMSAKSKNSKSSANILGASVRKGGASTSLGPVSVSVANSATKGGSTASSTGFAIVIPTNVGVFSFGFNQTLQEYHMRSATSDYVYGYMYQGGPAIVADGDNKIDEIPGALTSSGTSSGRIPWDWTYKGRTLESLGDNRMQPAYDMFTVESEGVSGTFRAFPRQTHQMFKLTSNAATAEDKMVDTYNPILNLDDKHWPSKEDFVYKEGSQRENSDYKYYNVNNTPFARYKTQFRNEGNRMVRRINDDLDNPLYSGISFLFLGEGGYYESEKMDDEIKIEEGEKKLTDYEPGKVSDILLKRTLNGKEYALYGSRKVEPIFEDDSPVSKIKGFVITNSDGSKYFFTKPVKSYLKIDYSINQEKGTPVFVDRKMSKDEGFWKHLGDGLATLFWPPKTLESIRQAVMGHLDETCQPNPSDETMLYSYQVNMNPYATQWLLEEIQGPDYIQLDKVGNDMSKNIGYNVRFEYTDPSLYQWRSPYAQPDIASKDLPNFRMPRNGLTPVGCDTKMFQASFGVKEYRYLKSIETATHKVVFDLNNPETEERVDGKGWYFNRINGDNKNTLPILTTAAIALRIKSVNSEYIDKIWIDKIPFGEKLEDPKPLENWHDAQYEYDALYVNVEIPELLLADLKKNPKLNLESDFYKKMVYLGNDRENAIVFKDYDNEFTVEVDKDADHWYEKTAGDETKYGLYKIKLKKGDDKHLYWYASNKGQKLHNSALQGKVKLFLGEMGAAVVTGTSDKYALTQCSLKEGDYYVHNVQSSYYPLCNDNNDLTPSILDWSDIVFVDNQNDESMNQMRYLKKISYYKKDKNGAFDNKNPYREYNFEYDYSLHPKTLNSYCKSRYPKELADIQNSPLQANLDVCSKTDNTVRNLYGKLTLKSIYEKGCQNGRCASLPPFKFDYNVASQTSTRYSSKDAWAELSKKNCKNFIVGINSEFFKWKRTILF